MKKWSTVRNSSQDRCKLRSDAFPPASLGSRRPILVGQGRDIRGIRCLAAPLVAACAPLVLVLTLLASPVFSAVTITEFPLDTSAACIAAYPDTTLCSGPQGITAGPDGNLWFGNSGTGKIGRITPAGVITEYMIPTPGNATEGITAGPDGNLWFAEFGMNQIGRINPTTFAIDEFPLSSTLTCTDPNLPCSAPTFITAGPDGNLWFAQLNADLIGRITPDGTTIDEFLLPTNGGSQPFYITRGPVGDGNLWFTESTANKIGRINPTTLAITEYAIPTLDSYPLGITAGPDDNLWFTEAVGNNIGRITPAGVITEFPIPTPNAFPLSITAGADGNLYFTEAGTDKIGRINPSTFAFDEFPLPTSDDCVNGPNFVCSFPYDITRGPDGKIWFAENGTDMIGRLDITTDPTTPPGDPPAPPGCNMVGHVHGNQHFKATVSGKTVNVHVEVDGDCDFDKKANKVFLHHAKVYVVVGGGPPLINAKQNDNGKHSDVSSVTLTPAAGTDPPKAVIMGTWQSNPFTVVLTDGGKPNKNDTVQVTYPGFPTPPLSAPHAGVHIHFK